MIFTYISVLLLAMAGMAMIDRRYKLAFWHDAYATAKIIGLGMLFFIIWDAAGIYFGIFWHGNSPWALPFTIAPEFPIEEVFFLFHLCYTTLVIYRFFETRVQTS